MFPERALLLFLLPAVPTQHHRYKNLQNDELMTMPLTLPLLIFPPLTTYFM